MPAGSDAVIMQEFGYEEGEYVHLEKPVTFNQDVSLQGKI
ncbi:MAG: hypothetical protein CIT01_06260 [Methanobacterium sp. BRmetb2]|jgi:molybdopterin biosynthesis enzyme|nr:MAG: hypothetical protein CIT01_06260 [Methanobacterium sp. BRmetb2]